MGTDAPITLCLEQSKMGKQRRAGAAEKVVDSVATLWIGAERQRVGWIGKDFEKGPPDADGSEPQGKK